VINRGVEKERVEAAAHVTMKRLDIRPGGTQVARTGSVSSGVVFTRTLHAPAAPVNLSVQKVGEHTTAIHHESIVPRPRENPAAQNTRKGTSPNGGFTPGQNNNPGQQFNRPGNQPQQFNQPRSAPSGNNGQKDNNPRSLNTGGQPQSNPRLARDVNSDPKPRKTAQPSSVTAVNISQQQSHAVTQKVPPVGNAAMNFQKPSPGVPSGMSTGSSAPIPARNVLQTAQGVPLRASATPAQNTHVYESKPATQFKESFSHSTLATSHPQQAAVVNTASAYHTPAPAPAAPAVHSQPAVQASHPQPSSGQSQSQGRGGNGNNNHP
jgi:hypothetical protein